MFNAYIFYSHIRIILYWTIQCWWISTPSTTVMKTAQDVFSFYFKRENRVFAFSYSYYYYYLFASSFLECDVVVFEWKLKCPHAFTFLGTKPLKIYIRSLKLPIFIITTACQILMFWNRKKSFWWWSFPFVVRDIIFFCHFSNEKSQADIVCIVM